MSLGSMEPAARMRSWFLVSVRICSSERLMAWACNWALRAIARLTRVSILRPVARKTSNKISVKSGKPSKSIRPVMLRLTKKRVVSSEFPRTGLVQLRIHPPDNAKSVQLSRKSIRNAQFSQGEKNFGVLPVNDFRHF